MSDKSYCAVNTKYYKHSNSSGELGHVIRSFLENKNAYDELTKNNFGFVFNNENNLNIEQQYILKLEEAKRDNNKVFQKNSVTYIDSVIILDSKKFLESEKKDIEAATKAYMLEFKEKYGYEPIGFEFHLDEGTKIPKSDYDKLTESEKSYYVKFNNSEDEYIKNNIHAHAIFLNYDFDKKKTCHRNMRIKDWENTQDLLHKHFQHLGFDRGISKKLTKKEHLEKSDYLKKLQLEIEKNENLKNDLDELKCEYSELLDDAILTGLEKEITDETLENYSKMQVLAKKTLESLENSKNFKQIVDFTEKRFHKIYNFIKDKGTEFLNLLGVSTSSPPPKNVIKSSINDQKEDSKPDLESEIIKEPEPEEKQEELTVFEQMKIDSSKGEEIVKKMSDEEKKEEYKKIKQRRKHGRGTKNK